MATIGFISLGCPKALVDSEEIITRLRSEGYDIAKTYQDADLVIVNTCGFIDEAVKESLEVIGEALDQNGKVIVTGCLGVKKNKEGKNLVEDIHPRVLAVTGPRAFDDVLAVVHQYFPLEIHPFIDLIPRTGIKLTPRHYAYLKISEGCNNHCTFCIIPSMRGRLVSRPIHEILSEAENLFANGTKELLIISQDTGAYGLDLKYRFGFWQGRPVKTCFNELASLLGELAAKYDTWVRFHYLYPYPHIDELVSIMSVHKNIVPYLDMPLQHADLSVLKRMRRPGNIDKIKKRIDLWRKRIPNLVIRSTFIVGFPGETEKEFNYLLQFIKEMELDRVGCFAYSPIDGAEANNFPDLLPYELREARRAEFMLAAQKISATKLRKKIGNVIRVLIDEVSSDVVIARSEADSPGIDGVVYAKTLDQREVKVGQFADMLITDSDEHDLWAEFYI